MSTWAERLSARSASPQSTPISAPSPAPSGVPTTMTPLAPDGPIFHSPGGDRATPSGDSRASPSASIASPYAHSPEAPSPHPGGAAVRGQTLAEIREEFRQQAEARNCDRTEVPFIHIPPDCWEWVTAYLRETDVLHLASTCRRLWVLLRYRDSLWTHQLRAFHGDMRAMRGGALLESQFALPPRGTMPGYEWFLRVRQLYTRDARREWHFKERTQLDDRETGSFTVAMHGGVETRERLESAPLSLPCEPLARSTVVTNGGTAALSSSSSPAAAPAPPAGQEQAPRPRVGEPLMLSNVPPLVLTVQRPLRVGEDAAAFIWPGDGQATEDRWEEEGELYEGDEDEDGDPDAAHRAPPAQGPEAYWRLQESTGMTEEELLQYVLAISLADADEAAATAATDAGTRDSADNTHVPCVGVDSRARSQRPRHVPSLAPALKPSELMTLVDFINHGSVENSRTEVINVTDLFNAQCGPVYAKAVAETLRSAMRRRLHFPSHHRALLNNGETRRNRLGRHGSSANTPAVTGVLPTGTGESVGSGEVGSDQVRQEAPSLSVSPSLSPAPSQPQRQPARRLQASDVPGGYPVNRMFAHFTGKLLEISRREAQLIATDLLGKPEVIEDFCIFPLPPTPTLPLMRRPVLAPACGARRQQSSQDAQTLHGVTYDAELDVMPSQTTRFFLAPELCVGGRVGLILIDPVRVLVVVEKEKVLRDDPSWSGPLRVDRTGRVYTPGQGYNAQYYEIDEARGRFV